MPQKDSAEKAGRDIRRKARADRRGHMRNHATSHEAARPSNAMPSACTATATATPMRMSPTNASRIVRTRAPTDFGVTSPTRIWVVTENTDPRRLRCVAVYGSSFRSSDAAAIRAFPVAGWQAFNSGRSIDSLLAARDTRSETAPEPRAT